MRPRRISLCLLVCAGVALAGCGSFSSTGRPGALADRFIPEVREVAHHPDSLEALSIREGERKLELDFKMSPGEVRRKWSCRAFDVGDRSYATLWSREVLISFLESELGIGSLSKERAKKLLAERQDAYRTGVRVEVFLFESEGSTFLAGPGPQVELRVADTSYAPTREDHGPLRKAVLQGETTDHYRQNTFHFSRIADGTDILKDAGRVAVEIDGTVAYAWDWRGADPAAE